MAADASVDVDLAAGKQIWLNLDFGQNGLGSASCGPGDVLLTFRPITG